MARGRDRDAPAVAGRATTGTFTFFFSDIEGSTELVRRLGEAYGDVLARYRAILRAAVDAEGGEEVDAEGDGLFCAFARAPGAVGAAVEAQRALAAETWPPQVVLGARMGLHTGEAAVRGRAYVGLDVHRAARVAAAGHGGQVLLSDTTRALVVDRLPDGVTLRDLGEHRLPDLTRPERLWQVAALGLPHDFPPLRTLDATPNNLPTQLTSFVGRTAEVAEVGVLLHSARLVTLTGPGGTGKTRLALQAAAALAEELTDGVFFVPLAGVRDPDLLPSAILEALGMPEAPGRRPAEHVIDHLQGRELLLVLDNFEQLLEAGPYVADLLRAASGVNVLVTSRAPLHVSGEQEFGVPPLPVPDAAGAADLAALSQYEAVALFIQRARAVAPSFEVTAENAPAIAEICARLDGLPLAIELAAARVKLLPPEAMLPRLGSRLTALGVGARDLPARQQTLRGAISWSFDLLDEEAQRLLARLAVFEDGWLLETAEEVCGGDLDVLTGLEALVDHSLVSRREQGDRMRFAMLETIREFATEQLEASAEAENFRGLHARAYLAMAEEAAQHLLGRDQGRWTRLLAEEQGNCRAALNWFCDVRDTEHGLRLGAALWRFWQKRSVHEGRAKLAAVLVVDGVEQHPRALLAALEAAGGLAYWDGDMPATARTYERALTIAEHLDDPAALANARYNLSFTRIFSDDSDKGQSELLLGGALATFVALGDRAGEAKVRWGLGVAATFGFEYETARSRLEESLALSRAVDDVFLIGWSLHMLGTVHTRTGRPDEARTCFVEALAIFLDATDVAAITLLLDDFSELAGALGDPETEVTLAGASRALQHATGSELAQVAAEMGGRAPIDAERFASAWERGLAMSMDEALALARTL
jgi:predicted ATPase/class 3 adenylate cyclase